MTFQVKEGAAEELAGADIMDGETDGGRKMDWKLPAGMLTAVLLAGVLWIKKKKVGRLDVQRENPGQNGWDELEEEDDES